MSDHVLFAPALTPLAKAYVSHYSIINQPDGTYFDTALGILFGPESIVFDTTPIVVVHYYDKVTVNFAVSQPATTSEGEPDAGSASIISALSSYVTYYNNYSYTLAYANFVFAIRILISYPSTYNINYMINFMARYSADAFSWDSFFTCRGNNRTITSEQASAFYIAVAPLISDRSVNNPMRNILQYSEMSTISGIILTDYVEAGI